MNPIIKEIFNDKILSEDESNIVFNKLRKSSIRKGEFLLKAKAEVTELFYVHSGCLRSYIVDLEGKEHIMQFAVKGWWISDYIALFGREKVPAVSYIESIKDAIIYRITKSDFDKICYDLPKVGHFHLRKMELAFASFQNRILENLTLSAKERYINFVTSYPTIVNDVKNYHIASYLGITTESLSRIRKELSST